MSARADGLAPMRTWLRCWTAVFCLCACSQGSHTSPSASASATSASVCDARDQTALLAACASGVGDCCEHLTDGKDPDKPEDAEAFSAACAGGVYPACHQLAGLRAPPAWKWKAFSSLCGRLRGDACRVALELRFLDQPDDAESAIRDYCKDRPKDAVSLPALDKPGDANESHSMAEVAIPCTGSTLVDAAPAVRVAIACREGEAENCGGTAHWLAPLGHDMVHDVLRSTMLWSLGQQGFDSDATAAIAEFRTIPNADAAELESPHTQAIAETLEAHVTIAGSSSEPAMAIDAIKGRKRQLATCTAVTDDVPKGFEDYLAHLSKTGEVVAVVDPRVWDTTTLHRVATNTKVDTTYSAFELCVRGFLQGLKLGPATPAPTKAIVRLKFQ